MVARTLRPGRVMHALAGATLLVLVSLLGSSIIALAADPRLDAVAASVSMARSQVKALSAVRLQLSVGYQNIYRGAAWTPVRVAVHNSGSADVSGILEIPQAGQSSAVGAQADFHGLYQAPVVVPAGSVKNVTIYVPGSGVQGLVNVSFLAGKTVLASASAAPIGVDTSALLIGVLSSGPSEMAWIGPAIQQHVTTHVIQLSPATVDPVPEALATFDIIALTNVDTSQLDRAQLNALQSYVQNGGSLLVVGGPTWQETLRPLQGSLLPGTVSGMRVLPDLHGLLPLVPGRVPAGNPGATAISVLSRPGGTVLASQAGVPLVVRKIEGQGAIEYLAFDPSLSPLRGWAGASGLSEHLVAMSAPLAISRTWSPSGFRARFQRIFQSMALTSELSNLPAATLPLLLLFAALTLGYVLILGPANFLLLRRIRRQSLAWITIPLLGLTYLCAIFVIATHTRASSTVLNTVGLVTLGSSSSAQPATFYMGLATPMSGNYSLSYSPAALPAPLPQISRMEGFSFRNATMLHDTPLGMRLQEDPQTTVTFLSMQRWSMRDMTLDTSVHIPGAVQSGLTVDARGTISGSIRNGTKLDLLDPVLVAGQSAVHLPTLPAGGKVYTRLQPSGDSSNQSPASFLAQLYGGSDSSNADDFGGGFGFRDCCNGVSYPQESQLIARVRNAIAMISQARPDALSNAGEVLLVGWTERPLASVSVDGSTPQRRDLTLVVTPLSVHFPSHGSFQLSSGALEAHLVDILPRAPQSSCCGFGFGPGGDRQQNVSIGSGGFLTFEFDLPVRGHVRFQHLMLSVSSQDDGVNAGRVYDWRALRWVPVDLSSSAAQLPDPNRFVSSHGQVMVRIVSTGGNDLTIYDPSHDIQLSGSGVTTGGTSS